MKTKNVLNIIVSLMMTPGMAFAGAAGESNTNNQPRMPTPASTQSTNSSAGQGKTAEYLGAGMNAASGAMFFSMSAGCYKWWFCAMGAISFVQAITTANAARKSGQVQAETGGMPPEFTDPSGATPEGLAGAGAGLTPEQAAAFNDLRHRGYVPVAGGVKLPDGRIVRPSDFGSAESMAAAGVPSGSIGGALAGIAAVSAEAMKKMDGGLANEANVVAMGLDSSGGGGGRGPASVDSDSNLDDYLNKLRNPFGMDANKKKDLVAGKTVTHGDDQIGVKMDDIFQMVHLRYQTKRAGDEFIEPAQATSAVPGAAAGKGSVVTPKRSR